MYAEVETHVAGSLGAEGLLSSPQMFNLRKKCDEALAKLFITFITSLLYVRHVVLNTIQNVYIIRVNMVRLYR
jgi:hypothetical protein